MASSDPKIVVDAILAEGSEPKIGVYPVTIRRYALLEKIDSPFVNPEKEFNVDSIVPTAFVMCQSPQDLKKWCNASAADVREAAFDWAEDLPLDDVPKMISAIADQFLQIQKAAPDVAVKGNEKKNQADGQ